MLKNNAEGRASSTRGRSTLKNAASKAKRMPREMRKPLTYVSPAKTAHFSAMEQAWDAELSKSLASELSKALDMSNALAERLRLDEVGCGLVGA